MATDIRTPLGRAPVIPVVLIGAGLYLAYFGIHYFKQTRTDGTTLWPSDPVKAILTGTTLATSTDPSASEIAQQTEQNSPGNPASPLGGGNTGTPTATGSAIADDALKYQGEGYIFGGPSQPGKWDCSSFVNYVVGHDMGLAIPGGSWAVACNNGNSHGPATTSWILFGTPVNYGSELPGDILVTLDHMGIVTGGGKYMSAHDPAEGTSNSSYTGGFPGGTPHVRRLSVQQSAPNQGQASPGSGGGHP